MSDPNATTQPDREITLRDVWEVLGSLAMRVGSLADAVRALTDQVTALSEGDRHFDERAVRAVRAATVISLRGAGHNED